MPIYEYECDSCQKRFEHLQRRAADLPRACPHCAGKRLRKVISSFSLTAAARRGAGSAAPSCASCSGGACPL